MTLNIWVNIFLLKIKTFILYLQIVDLKVNQRERTSKTF